MSALSFMLAVDELMKPSLSRLPYVGWNQQCTT